MRSEIDQVRDDVFGAATGVSAVRDRLDGLEVRMAKLEQMTAAAVESLPRLEDWQKFINERIQQGVHSFLAHTAGAPPPPPYAALSAGADSPPTCST
jgi:SAM-dependent MidA family methyltransferase